MHARRGIVGLIVGGVAAGCLLVSTSTLKGSDNCQAFLDGLRDPSREYYDLALDYLEAMRTSPMADKAFREVIDFEVGVTLLQGARLVPIKQRQKQLADARRYFQRFLEDHYRHPLETSTHRWLGSAAVEQGAAKIELAGRPDTSAVDKGRLMDQARDLLQEAEATLNEVDKKLSKSLPGYRKVKDTDLKKIAERDRVRNDLMLTRMALSKLVYLRAQTYDPKSNERKELLQKAAAAYSENYRAYHKYFLGYAFLIEEARCYGELRDYARALSLLNELAMPQPSDDARTRRVRTIAVVMALPIDLSPEMKRFSDAWHTFENWESNTQRRGESEGQTPAIRYFGGIAALECARQLDAADRNEAFQRNQYLQRAKQLLAFAAQTSGELKIRAEVKLNDPLLVVGQELGAEPKNYAEARDFAKLAWGQWTQADPKTARAGQLRTQALNYFRFALENAPSDAKIDDVAFLRVGLANLELSSGNSRNAAVLGESVARDLPDRPEGQFGAQIALRAYDRLCSEAGKNGNEESRRLLALAQYVVEQWPNSAAAETAWTMLARAAAVAQDPDRTLDCLSQIPKDSPRRAESELVVGMALWQVCQAASLLPEEQQPTKAKMTKMIVESGKMLAAAVVAMQKAAGADADVSPALAVGALNLAQVCLDLGEGKKAIAWLTDPKLGALSLLASNNAVAQHLGFRIDTMKTALRAFVATEQFDKAEATMAALEKTAGSAANIARIYLVLGRQIDGSLRRLRAEGSDAQATAAAAGFDFFLNRISTRPANETTFAVLAWAAEMYMSLGRSLDSDNQKPPPEAEEYYQKAATVYGRTIELCKADEKFAPNPKAIAQVQIRLSRCLRRMGKFSEAVDAMIAILKEREIAVDCQMEAAATYQAWGEESPERYLEAIRGAHPVKRKNGTSHLVWGWSGIARKTQSLDKLQDVYHEARCNLADCRMKYALAKADREKTELLEQAAQDILVIQRLQPDMGGPKWFDRYDALLRKIQGYLEIKQDHQGLKAAEKRVAAELSK